MDIMNSESAQAWLNACGERLTRGTLGAAIDGAMKRFHISSGNRARYSVDDICDDREAASVLRLAYRQRFGVEYARRYDNGNSNTEAD